MTKPKSATHGISFDLTTTEREMREEDAYVRNGHAARTLTLEPDLRIVLIVMNTGSRIAEHQARTTASIHALKGHLRLHVEDRVVDLRAGQLLVFEAGLRHDVEAVVESALMLTLGWSNAATGSE